MSDEHVVTTRKFSEAQPLQPDPAMKRLDKLVGTWNLTGRTLDSDSDNIKGWVTIEWLPGGHFLQLRGETEVMDMKVQSLEIIRYDPSTKKFPSTVYANLGGEPLPYEWDVQGDTVIHSGAGATYTGTFSEDGRTLTGGWRPDAGSTESPGNAYDAVMIRVD